MSGVLRTYDLHPDGVRIVIDWDKMVIGASVFVMCLNTRKAQDQLKEIAKTRSWEFKTQVRIEDSKMGIRVWRTA
jgi:hypothetical protein